MGPYLPMAPMTRDDGDDVSGGGDRVREDTDLERIRAYQVSTNNGSINTKKGHNTKRPRGQIQKIYSRHRREKD